MTEAEITALIRENERMKTALEAIKQFSKQSAFGSWRQRIFDLATAGLHLSS